MPELPELEGISNYLSEKLSGDIITKVETFNHTVIRVPNVDTFQSLLTGTKMKGVQRKGKLLLFQFISDGTPLFLYIDHGLTGRLAWEKKRVPAKIVFRIQFLS
ncbi:MAG: DNA-formamidopyrimidine glycosylase family protein, partial [Candidatus Hodarchaeales archaeon]